MCGLLVVIERQRPVDEPRFRSALHMLRHRGPDDEGVSFEPVPARNGDAARAPSIGLGHRRLSIIDLDARSRQPFASGRHSIVFNGAIYNFQSIGRQLTEAGPPLATSGDTEVLLRLLAAQGLSGLRQANGMWAFCWLDRTTNRLVASRDRYGKKPLFYCADQQRICFASEIAPLLHYLGRRPIVRWDAAATFLSEGWTLPDPQGHIHLEDIHEVRPGHALEVDIDAWTITSRPVVRFDIAPQGDLHDPRHLSDLLVDAIEARLVSDRKVGLLLSGGVDSSLILSVLAARGHADRVTCFTGDAGKSDDAHYARLALSQLGLTSVQVPLDYGTAGFEGFLDVCRHQEKPFPLIGNVLGAPALYAAAHSLDVRVVLDGAGADEVFGGYWQRYAGFAMRDAARAGDTGWLDAIRAGGMLPPALAALTNRDLVTGALPVPARDTLSAADVDLLTPAGRHALDAARSGDPLHAFDGSLRDALASDAQAGRMQEWLWQNDRNAMANSIENRSPFLDHRLAAFGATGYAAKFDGRWNKRELRRLFEFHVPLATATRADKQGFRWVYARFVRENRQKIIDCLGASASVAHLCDRQRFLDAAKHNPDLLEARLAQRLLVLAGLETCGLLAAA